MAFAKGRAFESPRGPVTLDKLTGDITQDIYIRHGELQDGQLQTPNLKRLPQVAPK
jgi:branched-chain amino acid transport system substrate-binding protein